MKTISFKIDYHKDRGRVITALANAGYKVKSHKVRERFEDLYFIHVEVKDEEILPPDPVKGDE